MGPQAVILRSFTKTTQQIPEKEKRLALKRAKELENGASPGLSAGDDERA